MHLRSVLVQQIKRASTRCSAAGKMRLKMAKNGWSRQEVLQSTALTPVRFILNLLTRKAVLKRKNWKKRVGFAAFVSGKTTWTKTAKFFNWLLYHQNTVIAARTGSRLRRANPGEIKTEQQQHPGTGTCGKKWPVLLELDHVFV